MVLLCFPTRGQTSNEIHALSLLDCMQQEPWKGKFLKEVEILVSLNCQG